MITNELRLIIQNRLNSVKTEYGIHEISYRTACDEKMFPHVVYDFSDVAPADMGRLDFTLDFHIWDKNQYTAFQIMDAIRELFTREHVIVTKRGKNGPTEQDIIPMMSGLQMVRDNDWMLRINVRICAQNPSLNPQQIVTAIENELTEYKPDFAHIHRLETIADDGTIFR